MRFDWLLFQTRRVSLGVALKFQNYILSPKDLTPCKQGWWKINEVMWVSVRHGDAGIQMAACCPPMENPSFCCDPADTAAATSVTWRCSVLPRVAWSLSSAAAPAAPSSPSAPPTAASTSANVTRPAFSLHRNLPPGLKYRTQWNVM